MVTGKLLVPAKLLRSVWPQAQGSAASYQFLGRHFKVSPIVAARRAQDLSLISRPELLQLYQAYEADEPRNKARKAGRGDFWNTQKVRLGGRFGAAVARATKEGRLLLQDVLDCSRQLAIGLVVGPCGPNLSPIRSNDPNR
ncbi:hypothetical protein CKO31_17155 [Thiohalocapsa halophila]|uniref:Transposase n=1 Tax=Thiohalocapsa halophila TaxID=69359 RepID=A0ABS1CKI5_9GAMM|nr:hypothetical protein [Thiohalocapsa halophila]MBK1632436.1 hypothetical protein [Thiohalocapsa halophila]